MMLLKCCILRAQCTMYLLFWVACSVYKTSHLFGYIVFLAIDIIDGGLQVLQYIIVILDRASLYYVYKSIIAAGTCVTESS